MGKPSFAEGRMSIFKENGRRPEKPMDTRGIYSHTPLNCPHVFPHVFFFISETADTECGWTKDVYRG